MSFGYNKKDKYFLLKLTISIMLVISLFIVIWLNRGYLSILVDTKGNGYTGSYTYISTSELYEKAEIGQTGNIYGLPKNCQQTQGNIECIDIIKIEPEVKIVFVFSKDIGISYNPQIPLLFSFKVLEKTETIVLVEVYKQSPVVS